MADSGPTILIADDVATNLRLLEAILSRAGYRSVVSTSRADRVVPLFQTSNPDLVLLDLHMPGLEAPELMAELRARLRPMEFMPILVMTADHTRGARERALEGGADDFLTKPVDRTEVVLRVRNLLHTRALNQRLAEYSDRLQSEITEERRVRQLAEAERARVARRIESLLAGPGWEVHVQPIVDLRSERMIGVEALSRFSVAPQRPPDEWFAEAASVGLGRELELAAVARALEKIPLLPPGTYLSVNVSPETLCSPGLMATLRGHAFDRIVVELTEHASVEDYDLVEQVRRKLRTLGARLAVDDTGAGISSLQHVIRLRPDVIKLDRSMIANLEQDPVRRALTGALVELSGSLHAALVAEGIETREELAALRSLGVPYGQGFLLGRPEPLRQPMAQAPGLARLAV